MARLILRYSGSGARFTADVQQIRAAPGLVVLDDSGRMLLVDAPDDAIPKLKQSLEDWSVTVEEAVPLPDTRPSLRKPSASS